MLYQIDNLVLSRNRANGYQLLIKKLQVPSGARLALTGPSGCGKSTTLDILGLSLAPASADQFFFTPGPAQSYNIQELWQQNRTDLLADLRALHIGYVLQSGELLSYLSTGENMLLTARLAGIPLAEAQKTAEFLAETLDILHLWQAMPQTLSVGERQRAAIVRALTARPQIIIADEPTAALDPLHARTVMTAFLHCIAKFGSSLILATHNAAWARDGGLIEIPIALAKNDKGVTAIVDYAPKEQT